jgi:hypothetical protein
LDLRRILSIRHLERPVDTREARQNGRMRRPA